MHLENEELQLKINCSRCYTEKGVEAPPGVYVESNFRLTDGALGLLQNTFHLTNNLFA